MSANNKIPFYNLLNNWSFSHDTHISCQYSLQTLQNIETRFKIDQDLIVITILWKMWISRNGKISLYKDFYYPTKKFWDFWYKNYKNSHRFQLFHLDCSTRGCVDCRSATMNLKKEACQFINSSGWLLYPIICTYCLWGQSDSLITENEAT